ncbi:hypothetical protein PGT21_024015 [Puccinia graminis f. sp. tritici]|uniref:Uncharacterized protein n=1 Tax=Puccinia graminis f. sp. tritici TaxID=56615 RepID=A0A5B0LWS1_PUCGR|nr:hypothetical protein PGTUg99_025330 [Puccinia graminis f. sp. tritici]KAA1104450.1 hypothetical protein PGT21_024015 [Puccinia graminis f. sp. tritici]
MNLNEIQARLANKTSVNVSIRTIKRYLKQLNLKLLRNDVTHGKVTIQQVYDAINDARTRRLESDAGYRRMRMILMREYDIQIPHPTVPEPEPRGGSQSLGSTLIARITLLCPEPTRTTLLARNGLKIDIAFSPTAPEPARTTRSLATKRLKSNIASQQVLNLRKQ